MSKLLVADDIENKTYLLRDQKVMFDKDLAKLYRVPTKVLNQAVKRNIKRFPSGFMFQLNEKELENWRSQIVTSNSKAKMSLRRPPFIFTEQGVAMLSSVINSNRAIEINISIMRVFVKIRRIIDTNRQIAQKISQLERKYDHHDYQIQKLFDITRVSPIQAERKIEIEGFKKKE